MKTILSDVQALFNQAYRIAFKSISAEPVSLNITMATQPSFGHYQCNSAMALAKTLSRSPRDIAQTLREAVLSLDHPFEKVEVAGPGFINIWLTQNYLNQAMSLMLEDSRCGIALKNNPTRVVVDFSSPNVAKEMHVGHLRSTVIGDCIARVLSFLGDDVLRLNHIGDWGTAFGMLIAYLEVHHPDVYAGNKVATLPELMQWYRASKRCFDTDEGFKQRSQERVVALQGGDKKAYHAWNIICDISRQAYQSIYSQLGIEIEERGESFYNNMLEETINLLDDKSMLEQSDGAQCVFLDGFIGRSGDPLPMIVRKKDGGFNYSSTDLSAIRHRVHKEKASRLIYVVDAGQSMHFKMIFAAAKKAGWTDDSIECLHVPFGLVLGADGKKYKTRSGDTERLVDLIDEAIVRAKAIMRERHPEWSDAEVAHAAQVLGTGAIKYADLSVSRTSDYMFSYDKMLSFEGNTVAFILYSYVRSKSVISKSSFDIRRLSIKNNLIIECEAESMLALKLLQLAEVLSFFAIDLMPNRLTDYLYGLSKCFNAFLRDCQVVGSEQELSRVGLCKVYCSVTQLLLNCLGIDVLSRM